VLSSETIFLTKDFLVVQPQHEPPEVVEAIQIKPFNLNKVERFVGGDLEIRQDQGVVIAGPEGIIHAQADYWVIRHADGRYSSCSPEDFAKFYTTNFSSI
jgi:hypothetical protein